MISICFFNLRPKWNIVRRVQLKLYYFVCTSATIPRRSFNLAFNHCSIVRHFWCHMQSKFDFSVIACHYPCPFLKGVPILLKDKMRWQHNMATEGLRALFSLLRQICQTRKHCCCHFCHFLIGRLYIYFVTDVSVLTWGVRPMWVGVMKWNSLYSPPQHQVTCQSSISNICLHVLSLCVNSI